MNLLCDEYDTIAMSTLQVLAGIASNDAHFGDVLRRILLLFERQPELVGACRDRAEIRYTPR